MRVLEALGDHGFAEDLSEVGRRRLDAEARVIDVQPDAPLLRRGDPVGGVYLVPSGSVRVYYVSEDGKEGTLYWIDPGGACILSVHCTCGGTEYPAWAQAESEPTRLVLVPASTFNALLQSEPGVQRFVFGALAGRINELMRIAEEATTFGLEQRLARLLLERADEERWVVMSQERIANHLGTAREVVSRLLRRMTAEGLLSRRRGRIRIVDAERVRALVEG